MSPEVPNPVLSSPTTVCAPKRILQRPREISKGRNNGANIVQSQLNLDEKPNRVAPRQKKLLSELRQKWDPLNEYVDDAETIFATIDPKQEQEFVDAFFGGMRSEEEINILIDTLLKNGAKHGKKKGRRVICKWEDIKNALTIPRLLHNDDDRPAKRVAMAAHS
jgi:hypothetical protein